MALVLSLQLYFTYRTQQDVFDELDQLSSTINKTTDAFVVREIFNDGRKTTLRVIDDGRVVQEKHWPSGADSLPSIKKEWLDQIKKSQNKSGHDLIIDEDIDRLVDGGRVLQFRTSRKKPLPGGKKIVLQGQTKPSVAVSWHDKDSLHVILEEVEIGLDHGGKQRHDSSSVNFVSSAQSDRDAWPFFSFVVPDFTVPDAPKLVRYNYHTAELQGALQKMRNRNILITLTIFALSMLVIMLLTGRFTRPINQLKNAFSRVVNGDLSVTVDSASRDEMGQLAGSFNLMVQELARNREKEQLLQRKERLASLGQLAAGVAHEIKNPLNAINLTMAHLSDKYFDKSNKEAHRYLEVIQNEIQRLDKLVDNFLNYVRSEELDLRPTDLHETLKEVLTLFEREFAAKKISVELQAAGQWIQAVDRERLKTALLNLVLNAIQAMPQGGRFLVQCDPAAGCIKMADNGCGISEKDLEHIFDLFYTTKSGGTGLGLPTAYKIIREHGAELSIRSEPGKGTEAAITFNSNVAGYD